MRLSDFLALPYEPLSRHPPDFARLTADAVPGRSRTPLLVAALASALVLGVGLGAAAFTLLDDGGTTIVREVTVQGSQPVAVGDLNARQIYDRASKSVMPYPESGLSESP